MNSLKNVKHLIDNLSFILFMNKFYKILSNCNIIYHAVVIERKKNLKLPLHTHNAWEIYFYIK